MIFIIPVESATDTQVQNSHDKRCRRSHSCGFADLIILYQSVLARKIKRSLPAIRCHVLYRQQSGLLNYRSTHGSSSIRTGYLYLYSFLRFLLCLLPAGFMSITEKLSVTRARRWAAGQVFEIDILVLRSSFGQ